MSECVVNACVQVSAKSGVAKAQNVETKKSPVWEYFVPGDNSATCKLCNKLVKRSRGNTSNLTAHLRCTHHEHYEVMKEEDARQKMDETNHVLLLIILLLFFKPLKK